MFQWIKKTMRSVLDNPNISLNDPGVWNQIFGDARETDAGVTINANVALEYPPVFQALSLISGDVARLPLEVFKRTAKGPGAREADATHPVYRVVRYKANRELSAFKFWRRYMVHALLWGNAYAFISRNNNGTATELFNLLPDRTYPERVNVDGVPTLVYVSEINGSLVPYRADEILHVEGIGLDNLAGADVIQKARNSWALGLAQESFASKFFKNGARVSGVLEVPSSFTKRAKDNLVQGFDREHSGRENFFKVAILRENAKFHQTSVSPADGQLTQSSELTIRQVARTFNLPPSKLGLSDSVSYSSKSEDNQAYLDETLGVWLDAITAECWLKLLSKTEQRANNKFFEHNTRKLLRLDLLKRYQAYSIGLRGQWLCPDEIRAAENMPPREDGRGCEFFTPNAGGDNDEKLTPDTSTPPDGDNARRRVVYELTARARHKAKNPRAFIEWIDGGLVYHRKQYQQLVGDDACLDDVLLNLRTLAEVNNNETLCEAVNEWATEYEGET